MLQLCSLLLPLIQQIKLFNLRVDIVSDLHVLTTDAYVDRLRVNIFQSDPMKIKVIYFINA